MTNAPKKRRILTGVIFTKAMENSSTEELKKTYDITDDEIDEIVDYHFDEYYGYYSRGFMLAGENEYGIQLTPNEIRLLTHHFGVISPVCMDWLRWIYTSGNLERELRKVNSRHTKTLLSKLSSLSIMLAWDRGRNKDGFIINTGLSEEEQGQLNARVETFKNGVHTKTTWGNDRENLIAQRAYTIYKHRFQDTPFYHNGLVGRWMDYSFRFNLTLNEFAFICHLFGGKTSFPFTLNALRKHILLDSKKRYGLVSQGGKNNIWSFIYRLLDKLTDLENIMNRRPLGKEDFRDKKSVVPSQKINFDAQTKGVAFNPSKAFAKTNFLPGRHSTLDFLYLSEDDVSPNEFVGSLLEAYNDDRYLRGLDETKHFSDIYHY